MLIEEVSAPTRLSEFSDVCMNAVLEVLGEGGTAKLLEGLNLNQKGTSAIELTPDDFIALCNVIIAKNGNDIGKGIVIRIGRSFFTHALRDLDKLSSLAESSYRLLPWQRRMDKGLDTMKTFIEGYYPVSINISKQEANALSLVLKSSSSYQYPSVFTQFLLGFVQEMLYVISNGHVFMVSACEKQDCGETKILIDKQPIY